MLFNSDVFLQFFAAFLLLYWLVRDYLKARNVLIVAASYLFYGWWDWRFLFLLFASSTLDFFVGLGLDRLTDQTRRKALFVFSISANLVILGFFKYYDFFAESLAVVVGRLGWEIEPRTLGLILPVGISFYTFQSMSYAIDVYRRQIPATRNFVDFLAYVSFFPQLVAGPIERASHLLPQFAQTLRITTAMLQEGIWLILWGMFKKVALADNFAPLVDMVYDGKTWTGPGVCLATIAFALQIYCDFSGYSDMARGLARVLGFDIMVNFLRPYAAVDIQEFWRRWHISLSGWLRDYLYIPLGGNRRGGARTYFNLLVTMFLGGLWHGAAWHFVLWGLWHGCGLAVHRGIERIHPGGWQSRPARILSWSLTLLFVLYGWLLFRARTMEDVVGMTAALGNWTAPEWTASFLLNLACFAAPLIAVEIFQERRSDSLVTLKLPAWTQAILQGALLLAVVLYWQREKLAFIYFQF